MPFACYAFRGVKDDAALIAEVAHRLRDRPHRIACVLAVATGVLAEWQQNGWLPDPLEPICGVLGGGRIG